MTKVFRAGVGMAALGALSVVLVLTSVSGGRAQDTKPGNQPAAAPELTCAATPSARVIGSAQLLADGLASAQNKNWQPVGGQITFTIQSFTPFDANASIIACLRWKTEPDGKAPYVVAPIARHELSTADKRTLTVTIIVPQLADTPGQKYVYALPFDLVPRADVRILIRNPDARQPIAVDGTMGITHLAFAMGAVAVVFFLTFGGLLFVVSRRLRTAGVPKANPFLTVISTPDGYASLSQFQILLWTYVVLLSAVYVMSLSGSLIEITSGTLVLLGISGAATIGSKIHGQPATPDPNAPPNPNPPPAAVEPHKPKWADLITNMVVTDDKKQVIEIDVTRVQMLYFTLVTAFFVGLRVVTTYVIPEIPDGFQILMGISNSVYMGSKVVQKKP